MQKRTPFNNQTLTITGEYSSQFEIQWILTNAIGSIKYRFASLQEAMDAAQYVEI